jgi:hypothetical protein
MDRMRTVMALPLRWLFKSVPGVALLLIALGVGVAYAATGDEGKCDPATAGAKGGAPMTRAVMIGPGPGPANLGDLSEADRKSLEDFGACMKESVPEPGSDGKLPDPADAKQAMDSAYDSCKAKLSDSLQKKFDEQEAQRQAYEACLSDNGAPDPPSFSTDGKRPEPPTSDEIKAIKKAQEACADKLPDGAEEGFGKEVHGPGPGGPAGPGMEFGLAVGPPPPPNGDVTYSSKGK